MIIDSFSICQQQVYVTKRVFQEQKQKKIAMKLVVLLKRDRWQHSRTHFNTYLTRVLKS